MMPLPPQYLILHLPFFSVDVQRGLAEITSIRPLTMEQEWARNHKWKDWKKNSFSGWAEFQYVSGLAVVGLSESVKSQFEGNRDKGHEGWTLEQFCTKVNAMVLENARQKGIDDVPELTSKEVLAIRLYSGPAYQPINEFLREVSKLGAHWRKALSRSHQFSYASTVRHLSDGLRKLARVTMEVRTMACKHNSYHAKTNQCANFVLPAPPRVPRNSRRAAGSVLAAGRAGVHHRC